MRRSRQDRAVHAYKDQAGVLGIRRATPRGRRTVQRQPSTTGWRRERASQVQAESVLLYNRCTKTHSRYRYAVRHMSVKSFMLNATMIRKSPPGAARSVFACRRQLSPKSERGRRLAPPSHRAPGVHRSAPLAAMHLFMDNGGVCSGSEAAAECSDPIDIEDDYCSSPSACWSVGQGVPLGAIAVNDCIHHCPRLDQGVSLLLIVGESQPVCVLPCLLRR
jgi:hypothetical protein